MPAAPNPGGTWDNQPPCPEGCDYDQPYMPLPPYTGHHMNQELRQRGVIPAKARHYRDLFQRFPERR